MKTYEEFAANLEASRHSVELVAQWMAARGCDILVRPTLLRPEFDAAEPWRDSGDIEIRQTIEVKRRNLAFEDAATYPFPTIFIDSMEKIDATPPGRIFAYMIVNRTLSHAAVIKPDTRSHWKTTSIHDRKDRRDRAYYTCPKELAVFQEIDTTPQTRKVK